MEPSCVFFYVLSLVNSLWCIIRHTHTHSKLSTHYKTNWKYFLFSNKTCTDLTLLRWHSSFKKKTPCRLHTSQPVCGSIIIVRGMCVQRSARVLTQLRTARNPIRNSAWPHTEVTAARTVSRWGSWRIASTYHVTRTHHILNQRPQGRKLFIYANVLESLKKNQSLTFILFLTIIVYANSCL